MYRQKLPPLVCPQLHVTSYTLCVLLCVTSLVQCSDITFTSSIKIIKPLVTDSLALRCGVKDGAPTGTSGIIGKRNAISTYNLHSSSSSSTHTPSGISKRDVKTSDIVFVSSIRLIKNNEDVATVTEHSAAKVFNNTGGVHVIGNVTASGAERGFLQVTWDYPVSSVSGSYQCIVTGYDVDDHFHALTETVTVDDNEVTLSDVVNYIHQLKLNDEQQKQLIEKQKQSIEQQKQSIEQQKQSIEQQKQVNEQQKQVNEQQKQVNGQLTTDISQMKAEISALQTSNADLKTKADTKVLFTAYLSSSVTLSGGNVLVFDKLITSIGGGYSTSSGIFTAPVSGYFVFELHVMGQTDKYANFFIKHNNNIVAYVQAEDALDRQQASNTVSLLLKKGDEVKVVAAGTVYPYGDSNYVSTTFSGYLIDLQ